MSYLKHTTKNTGENTPILAYAHIWEDYITYPKPYCFLSFQEVTLPSGT